MGLLQKNRGMQALGTLEIQLNICPPSLEENIHMSEIRAVASIRKDIREN